MGFWGEFFENAYFYFCSFKKLSSIVKKTLLVINIFMFIVCTFGGEFEMFMMFLTLEIIFTIPIAVVLGIIGSIKIYPYKRKLTSYNQIFETLNIKGLGGELPIFLGESETEYLRELTFKSQIPLSLWQSKKSVLETNFHMKISQILTSEKDNNITHILFIKNELPEEIKWEIQEHMFLGGNLLTIGMSYFGRVPIDLDKNAHIFIAGETGSGKSNILKGLIFQALYKKHDVKLIDFKRGVSFAQFDEYIEIISEHEVVKNELEKLVKTTNERFDLFRERRVEDINEYNALFDSSMYHLKRIIVFIDELAELIKTSDKETTKSIISSLESLTRISRAAGVHLIMGIQRPDATIISGQIKNNVSCRICGRFIDPEPSRIMLGNDMATNIPKIRGRFILKDDDYIDVQAFRFTNLEMNFLIKPYKYEPVEEVNQEQETEKETVMPKEDKTVPLEAVKEPNNGINFNF